MLHLQATDADKNASSVVDVAFTLDTSGAALSFDLDPAFDSLPVGDHQTTFAVVSLVGQAGRGASVDLQGTTQHTTADAATGQFRFDNVALAMGANVLTVVAPGAGGNQSTFSLTITRSVGQLPTFPPIESLSVMVGHVLSVPLGPWTPTATRLPIRWTCWA